MFLDFTPGHWLTIFRDRLSGRAPEPQMRIMTKDQTRRLGAVERHPRLRTQPPRFVIKLLAAWAAMDSAVRKSLGDGA